MLINHATYAEFYLSEDDIKLRFIRSSLENKGWDKFYMSHENVYSAFRLIHCLCAMCRMKRIQVVMGKGFLDKCVGWAQQVIESLMERYGETGFVSIGNLQIFTLSPFTQIAKLPRITKVLF